MRAIWSWLVILEIWQMSWGYFLCHLSCYTLACLDMKKIEWTNADGWKKFRGYYCNSQRPISPKNFWSKKIKRLIYSYNGTDMKLHIMLSNKAWHITFRSLVNHYSDSWKQVLPCQEVRWSIQTTIRNDLTIFFDWISF